METIKLRLVFGKDQEPLIDKVIDTLKSEEHEVHYVCSDLEREGEQFIVYDLLFEDLFAIYRFGYLQRDINPMDAIAEYYFKRYNL